MTNPKDLEEMLRWIDDGILDMYANLWEYEEKPRLKAHLQANYRPISDIKEAVGEMEETELGRGIDGKPKFNGVKTLRNQLRKEIYTALGIEEGE